jgi:hypothetical protein
LMRSMTPPISMESANSERLAVLSRSIEFRIRQYPPTLQHIKNWCEEWKCTPAEHFLVLRTLLQQLPQVASREVSDSQRKALVDSILYVASKARVASPEVSLSTLGEALAFFFNGQDAEVLPKLRQLQSEKPFGQTFRDLHQSEYQIWQRERKSWQIFPIPPQVRSLGLEQTLYLFSRSLMLQQRSFLRKYNIQKALELTSLHMGLAVHVAQMAWTPADFAVARSMMNRALTPFWKDLQRYPSAEELQQNYLTFVDEQGDPLTKDEVRKNFSVLESQEKALRSQLPLWRGVQQLASWNAGTVLGNLFLHGISLSLAWITLAFSTRSRPLPQENLRQPSALLLSSVFLLPSIGWTLLSWPAGGKYILGGLLLSWTAWFLCFRCKSASIDLINLRTSMACVLVTLLVTILLTGIWITQRLLQRHEAITTLFHSGWLTS